MQDIDRSLMVYALKKYGAEEYICNEKDIQKIDSYTVSDVIQTSISSDLSLRAKLIPHGRILEENLDEHFYIMLIPFGLLKAAEAMVVVKRHEDKIELIVYSKDTSVPQKSAFKAMKTVKTFLK